MQVYAKIDAFGCCRSVVWSEDPAWISLADTMENYIRIAPEESKTIVGKYYDGKNWLHTEDVIDTRFRILAV